MAEIEKIKTHSLLKYIYPDVWSDEQKEAKPIDAEEIVKAINNGKKIEIINAVIKGSFTLRSVNVESEITIKRTKIKGPLDWSYSTFKRVINLGHSVFETDAIFRESDFKKSAKFNKSVFKCASNFLSARIDGNAYFNETVFCKLACFNGVHIDGCAFFKLARFKNADFVNARIGSDAEFTGAVFKETANFIGAHIEGGVEFTGALFNGSTRFNNSHILGPALFKTTIFKNKVDFTGVRIGSDAEFTGAMFWNLASFNHAQIDGTASFNPALLFTLDENQSKWNEELVGFFTRNFRIELDKIVGDCPFSLNDDGSKAILKSDVFGTYEFIVKTINGILNIYNPVNFNGEADFIGTRLGKANFNDAVFGSANFNEDVFKVCFNKAQIKNGAFFKSATFNSKADFGYAQIGDNAEFTGALFKKSARFNSVNIEGGALFNTVIFENDANFAHARIGSNAEFASVLFKRGSCFNNSQIEGMALFNLTSFEGKIEFINARISSDAGFSGVVFKGQASFNGTQIEGSSFFSAAYLFNWDEILGDDNKKFMEFVKLNYAIGLVTPEIEKLDDGAIIKVITKNNQMLFTLTDKKSKVLLTTDNKTDEFIAKTENNKLKIYKSTTFEGETSFMGARFGGDTRFYGAIFGNNLSFQDTIFGTLHFAELNAEEPDVEFQATIDLRGCTYNRIHPVSVWKPMMECLNPYDRQPFTQLEETFRRAGLDQLADDVHYNQKSREFTENITIEKPSAWLLDCFLWALTGYGVRPIRLLWAVIPILFFGTVIFQLEGAVRLDMQPYSMISTQATLSLYEAFWVSLNTFLPIEIPSGADWIPSSQIIPWLGLKFTTFATLSSLAGWILVPVGVASISGLLKGSKKQ